MQSADHWIIGRDVRINSCEWSVIVNGRNIKVIWLNTGKKSPRFDQQLPIWQPRIILGYQSENTSPDIYSQFRQKIELIFLHYNLILIKITARNVYKYRSEFFQLSAVNSEIKDTMVWLLDLQRLSLRFFLWNFLLVLARNFFFPTNKFTFTI